MKEEISNYIKSIEKHWIENKKTFQIKITFKSISTKIHYVLKNIKFIDEKGNKTEYGGLSVNGFILNNETSAYIDSKDNCSEIEFNLILIGVNIEEKCRCRLNA